MQYIIFNKFSLLEILVNINNHKHYLIINSKFHSPKINNVHTMSLYDMLAAPTKVIWPAAFFLNSKHLSI